MQENPIVHAIYTTVVLALDNVSTLMAVTLFSLQLIILLPKVVGQIGRWRMNE